MQHAVGFGVGTVGGETAAARRVEQGRAGLPGAALPVGRETAAPGGAAILPRAVHERLAGTIWSPATAGRDPANPARYTRSLSSYGGYIGIGWAKFWTSESTTYGIKLDGDFRLGYLESDIALLTSEGDQAEALYGVPHRATFFVNKAVGIAEFFAEAGYRG
ncbi:MAG TPA: hypothetical protein PLQ52_08225 [Lacunisphaera sp.]|nr:hypothetical protein [Lacunisphaera sp.]HQY06037.1 hypothetical protein [Lacunisphaera sp.]